ncbi:MAG: lysostaphin resistance A-like protein [Gemmatimonadales bacterium]
MRLALYVAGSFIRALLWSLAYAALFLMPPILGGIWVLALAALFVRVAILRPVGDDPRRATLELRLGRPPMRWLLLAAASLPVFDLGFYAVYGIIFPPPSVDPFREMFEYFHRPLGWFPILAAVCIAAPLVEEVAFRGWIQTRLEGRFGPEPAIVFAAVLFSVAHGVPEYLVYYLVLGTILGLSVWASGSIWTGVILHGVLNLASIISELFPEPQGTWTSDSRGIALVAGALLLGAAGLGWAMAGLRKGRREK